MRIDELVEYIQHFRTLKESSYYSIQMQVYNILVCDSTYDVVLPSPRPTMLTGVIVK